MNKHWFQPNNGNDEYNGYNKDNIGNYTQNNYNTQGNQPNYNTQDNQPNYGTQGTQNAQGAQGAQGAQNGYYNAQGNQPNYDTQGTQGTQGTQNGYYNTQGNNKKSFRHKANPFRFTEPDGSTRHESKTQYYDDVETLLKIKIDDIRYFGARFFQMSNTPTNLMRNYDMILQLGIFNSTEYKASIGVIIQPRDAIIISLQLNDLIHQRRNFVEFYKHGKVVTSDRIETKTKVGFAIQWKQNGTFVLSVVSYDDRDQIQHRVDLTVDIYHIIEFHILLKQYPTSTINTKFNNAIVNESLKRILSRVQDLEDQSKEANAIKAHNHDTYNNGIVSQDNMSMMMRSDVQVSEDEYPNPESGDLFKVSLPFNSDDFDTSSTVSIMNDTNDIKNNVDILDEPIDNITNTVNFKDDANTNVPSSEAKRLMMGAFDDVDSEQSPSEPDSEPVAEVTPEPITETEIIPEPEPEIESEVIHEPEPEIEQEHIPEPEPEIEQEHIPEPVAEIEVISEIKSDPIVEVNPSNLGNAAIDENFILSETSAVDLSEVNINNMSTKEYNTTILYNSKLFKYLKSNNALVVDNGIYKLNTNGNVELTNILYGQLNNSLVAVHLDFIESIKPTLIFLVLNTSTDAFNQMLHSLNIDVIHGIYKSFMIIFNVPANNVDSLLQGGKTISDAIIKKSLIERVASLLQIHNDAIMDYNSKYSEYFIINKEIDA